MSDLKDLSGQKFGRLTVISRAQNNIQNRAMWNCVCDCGGGKTTLGVTLRNGRTKSCGCLRSELNIERFTVHGCTNTPEYAIWMSMKQRCNNPSNKEFSNYGNRGIKICERWYTFKNFLADMGNKPGNNFSIERVDNSKGYNPDNCIWGTGFEQANNTRKNVFLDIKGEKNTVAQWCRLSGVSVQTVHYRLRHGWEHEKAVFQPAKTR